MDKRYLLIPDGTPGQVERALGLPPGRALMTPMGVLVEDTRPKLEVVPIPERRRSFFMLPALPLIVNVT